MNRLRAWLKRPDGYGITPLQWGAGLGLLLVVSQAIALALLSGPLLILHLFDGILETQNYDTFVALGIMFVVAQLLAMVLKLQRTTIVHAISMLLERRLFVATLRCCIRQARQGKPERAAAALSDFSTLRRFLAGSAFVNALDLLAMPMTLVFLFFMHPAIGWLALAACLSIFLFSLAAHRRGAAEDREAQRAASDSIGALTRRLQRQDEVRGLGLLPGILRQWLPMRRAALGLRQAASARNGVMQSLGGAVGSLYFNAAAALAAWLIINNLASPAAFASAIHVFSRVTGPAEAVARQWSTWALVISSYLSLRRQIEAFDATEEAFPAEAEDDGALRLVGLRLGVPDTDRVLVEDLSLTVPPGAVVLVTGRNATGKTTLLRALMGLVTPDEGCVLWRGTAVHLASRAQIGQHLGYAAQRPQLLRGTVLDNISRFLGVPEAAEAAARSAGAHDMVGRLGDGYLTQVDPRGSLSGGQQRQVALARALYASPGLLLLDEPEVGLDPPALASLALAVEEARARGAIVFIVSHQIDRWASVADLELRLLGKGAWRSRVIRQAADPTPALEGTLPA